jgi:hypothetical protein
LDAEGNIYVSSWAYVIQNGSGHELDWLVKETPTGSGYIESQLGSRLDSPFYLEFVDANGNLYIRDGTQYQKWIPTGNSYNKVTQPTGGWGMDGSGNLYNTANNSVVKINFATPPSPQFKATNVGSKSDDSPEVVTLMNTGNAPLTFPVPSAGANPTVSDNFALDPSSTCPQINASGSPSSLAMSSSCTYAVNFTPTTTGPINGSIVVSDDALNAAGGTQTIPLSGSGTGGGVGMAVLTIGPGGVPVGIIVPNQTSASSANYSKVWVDAIHQTLIQGAIYLQLDSQGHPTCDEIGTSVTVSSTPQFGTLYPITEKHVIQGCGDKQFPFAVARHTWGQKRSVNQDPFVLTFRSQDGAYQNSYGFIAELAQITVSPATQIGIAPNPPLGATVSLSNPPAYAASYTWTINGGDGAIVFLNGQQTINSINPSIVIEEPNPTGNDIPFSVSVGVVATGGELNYGPISDIFCGCTVKVNSANLWNNRISVTLSGSSSERGILTISLVGLKSSFSFQYGASAVGPGTYTITMNRPSIPQNTYTYVKATWNASGAVYGSFGIKWKVFGVIRHSQYNTPYEINCSGPESQAWIIDTSTCSFRLIALKYDFMQQLVLNGTGLPENSQLGLLKYTSIDRQCSYPSGADPSNTFRQVSSVTGTCSTSLDATSVATNPSPASHTIFNCGDNLPLITSSNTPQAMKHPEDYCPTCGETHVDDYSSSHACSLTDYGSYWTADTYSSQ